MPVVDRVSFEPFVGIAPRVYSFMFKVGDTRKTAHGTAAKWEADDQCEPRFRRLCCRLLIEDLVTAEQLPATFVGEYAIMSAPPGSNQNAR